MSDRKKIIDLTEDDDVINSQNYEKFKSPIHSFKFSREQAERLEREKHIKEELVKLRNSGKVSTVKLTEEEEVSGDSTEITTVRKLLERLLKKGLKVMYL